MAVARSSFARERGSSEKAVELLREMSAKGWDAARMRAELGRELGVGQALESLSSCRAALGAWAAGERVYAQAALRPPHERLAGLRLAGWRQAKPWTLGKGQILASVDSQQAQWQAMQEHRESLEPARFGAARTPSPWAGPAWTRPSRPPRSAQPPWPPGA